MWLHYGVCLVQSSPQTAGWYVVCIHNRLVCSVHTQHKAYQRLMFCLTDWWSSPHFVPCFNLQLTWTQKNIHTRYSLGSYLISPSLPFPFSLSSPSPFSLSPFSFLPLFPFSFLPLFPFSFFPLSLLLSPSLPSTFLSSPSSFPSSSFPPSSHSSISTNTPPFPIHLFSSDLQNCCFKVSVGQTVFQGKC